MNDLLEIVIEAHALAEPLVVSIDVSEIAFTPLHSIIGSAGSLR